MNYRFMQRHTENVKNVSATAGTTVAFLMLFFRSTHNIAFQSILPELCWHAHSRFQKRIIIYYITIHSS